MEEIILYSTWLIFTTCKIWKFSIYIIEFDSITVMSQEHHGIWNHWLLFNCLFKLAVNKASKLTISGPLWGDSMVASGFPSHGTNNAKREPMSSCPHEGEPFSMSAVCLCCSPHIVLQWPASVDILDYWLVIDISQSMITHVNIAILLNIMHISIIAMDFHPTIPQPYHPRYTTKI